MNPVFHFQKYTRLFWYNIRYRIYPWKTISGIKMPVSLSMKYGTLRFISNGKYEQGEIEIIKNTLQPADIVLELGTGLGFVSAYCAKIVGSENVFTYEANLSLQKFIARLHLANEVHPNIIFKILGKGAGLLHFYLN